MVDGPIDLAIMLIKFLMCHATLEHVLGRLFEVRQVVLLDVYQ